MAVAWGRDTGILANYHSTMAADMKAPYATSPKLRQDNKLEMIHLLPNFLILCFGFATSAVVFFMECLGKKCSSRARPGAIRKQARTRKGVEHTERNITRTHHA